MLKKCRLCRREKTKLFLKGERCFSPKCPLERKGAVPPGVHGLKSSARLSDYGLQLREKQKMKRFYGVRETQFKNYFRRAAKLGGDVGENLARLLETRLDNVIYRLGLAPSRRTARQLVSHGFVKVNGNKVTIPSYQVKEKDVIEVSSRVEKIPYIDKWLKREVEIPDWLKRKGLIGQVVSLPKKEHFPNDIDTSLVIEFYSR
ncbi:30S ribosomal protein S4 [bacterium]|nr:30S ribosomal protein S4 [bacterium]